MQVSVAKILMSLDCDKILLLLTRIDDVNVFCYFTVDAYFVVLVFRLTTKSEKLIF